MGLQLTALSKSGLVSEIAETGTTVKLLRSDSNPDFRFELYS